MQKRNLLISSLLLVSLASCTTKENPTESENKKESSSSSIVITDSSSSTSSKIDESSSNAETNTNVESSDTDTSSKADSSTTDTSSVFEDKDPLANENYEWPFIENQAIKGNYNFSASTFEMGEDLSLTIDGNPVERLEDNDLDVTLYYETKDCNSDNANRAADYLYLNNKKISKLPSDGSKGVTFTIDQLDWGTNVVTVTIGGWWGAAELDYKTPLTGSADDFYIGNIYLETSTHQKISPSKMVFYKAKKNSGTFAKSDVEYEDGKMYFIGDGWSGQIAYDGSTATKGDGTSYNCPQKIDFYFEYDIPEAISSYSLDTTKYTDGAHIFELHNVDDEVVLRNHVIIDNNAPTIKSNIVDFAHINRKNSLEINFEDADEIVTKKVDLDGISILDEYDLSLLEPGTHNLSIYVKDRAGNDAYDYRTFYLEDYYLNKEEAKPTSDASIEATSNIVRNVGATNNVYDEVTISNLDKSLDAYYYYTATSKENEEIVVKAYNVNTLEYDVISKAMSGMESVARIDKSKYIDATGKAILRTSTNYVGNGSSTILWASDTQYLPKDTYGDSNFHDINPFYKQLMQYVKGQYEGNNMGYFVHTGDVVDDNPQAYDDATLTGEWSIASEAFKVLDDANVPYGVSAGNHDVGTDIHNVDYSYFSKYFGDSRFSNRDYYAGSLNDNNCHYDLITLGDYDFIVLYLGFGIEAREETVLWANKVLKQYSHRNAIIATHGYLNADGLHDTAIQAEDIYQKIAIPNDNVKFVFCGHTDGSHVVKQQVGDRYFYEVLNCYQFVEQQKYSNLHKINGYNCNGEGFIKSVTFENNKVSFATYSPITHVNKDPLSNTSDGTYNIELLTSNRDLSVEYTIKQ